MPAFPNGQDTAYSFPQGSPPYRLDFYDSDLVFNGEDLEVAPTSGEEDTEDPSCNAQLPSQQLNSDGAPKRSMNTSRIFACKRCPMVSSEQPTTQTAALQNPGLLQVAEKTRVQNEQWKLLQGRYVMVTHIADTHVRNYRGAEYLGPHNSAELLQKRITNIEQYEAYYDEMQELLALLHYQNMCEGTFRHFPHLDVCLRIFLYPADVARVQWIGTFYVIQRIKFQRHERVNKPLIKVNGDLDVMRKANGQIDQTEEKLRVVIGKPKGAESQGMTTTRSRRVMPQFDTVTGNMSAQDMFQCLVQHGCTDLSLSVDPDRYSESAIASGGFGDIWQAWMKDGTLVAVKCLRLHMILEGDRKGMKRAMRELYNWSKAQHENVQQLLGIVTFQGKLGMVSVWRPDGNLQQYIKKNPGVERYPLCVQLSKGVAYLHEIRMVHGDLKAINVLVCSDGIIKISDFDYSILSESTLRFSETSKTSGGTLRWMAPELLLCEEVDGVPPVTRNTKTDVYALGMTMLEIVSGRVPYHQFQYDRGIMRELDKKMPPNRPKELPGSDERATRMWALLLECWDHDPEARPDALSVLTSLQSFALEGI